MCKILEVSSSGFYNWLHRPMSTRSLRTSSLSALVRNEYELNYGRYGSPRITVELNKKGHSISLSYVARLMQRMDIQSRRVKKYKVTTDSSHTYPIADNLLERNFSAKILSQKWVGDITYIRTGSGWMYLSIVMDLADRKVIGWSLSNDMTAENTTISALKMAIRNRAVKQGLIFHSDRGIQYACSQFKEVLSANNVVQSMSRKGNCWDNAVAESFFKSLKCELVYNSRFYNREVARMELFRYIEGYYNSRRIHASLGYKTPNEMERLLLLKINTAA